MKTCRDCVYFLSHRVTGYNCGYLIKRVGSCNVICRYFNHTESYQIESREELAFQKEEDFMSGGEGYAEKIGRISRSPLQSGVSARFSGSRFGRIRELISRYRYNNLKKYFWFKDMFEGRKRDSGTRRRGERRNH